MEPLAVFLELAAKPYVLLSNRILKSSLSGYSVFHI